MAFPLNATDGDLYTNPSTGQTFVYNAGAWMLYVQQPNTTTIDAPVVSSSPNMTIVAGEQTGLPYISVNGTNERLILKSELDGTKYDTVEINAGYF